MAHHTLSNWETLVIPDITYIKRGISYKDGPTIYARHYYHATIARQKEYKRKKLYGLSPADYAVLLEKQNKRCAICRTVAKLTVDHSHTTGKVRGLLCYSCNFALGLFKDSRALLLDASAYLGLSDN